MDLRIGRFGRGNRAGTAGRPRSLGRRSRRTLSLKRALYDSRQVIGQTISHYRIVSKLGEGGMGVVYKAEDTKLERTVALKFLAAHLIKDEESRKRFEREAKAAAVLSHPNICTIHEIDEAQGKTFLALEFVAGESLEKTIERGPLALKEAVDIGRQVADGLHAAHQKKIVHRDIKPGNLLITPDGRVKILDFGLALLTEGSRLTQLDTTLGTAAYMSPEQAQGVEVDHRTDIWALGCVLYEMVCGQRPFLGEYDQALLYEIVHEEPRALTGLRTGVPVELEFMIGKCLAKATGQRYQNTADMIVDLGNLTDKLKSGGSTILRTAAGRGTAVGTGNLPGPSQRSGDGQAESLSLPQAQHPAPLQSAAGSRSATPRWKRRLPWAMFAVTAITLLAVSFVHFRETPPEAPLRRFAFAPESLYETTGWRAAISPNGRHIVYVAGEEESKLWVRDLDREEPRELDGTEGAQQPFWSPDSQFIGFATNRELKKISVQGGPAITLCPLPGGGLAGGGWSPDGDFIALGSGGPSRIYEVPARGGEPRLLFEPVQTEKGTGITSPHLLPLQAAARSIIFDLGAPSDRDIAVKNLETGEWEVLAEGAYPVYSPSGHILYQTNRYQSGLWALPFSIETLQPTGEAFPIGENVGGPSVGADGTLVYLDFLREEGQQLVWRDRGGKKLEVIGQPQETIRFPALSPDGGRVAVSGREDNNDDVWVHEVGRPLKRRLTFNAAVQSNSIWSPSGKEITFRSSRQANADIYSRSADGAGEPVLLVGTDLPERPSDWSPDGKYLLYWVDNLENGQGLWYLESKEDGSGFDSAPFLQTSFNEHSAKLSAQGRFVAYVSDQSGQDQVYVRPFPKGEGQWQVSAQGGGQPQWSRDGRELFYVEGDTLIAVEVSTSPSFTTGATTRLFRHPNLRATVAHRYDVSPDGQRFVLVETIESEEAKAPSIHVVENWFSEFRDRQTK